MLRAGSFVFLRWVPRICASRSVALGRTSADHLTKKMAWDYLPGGGGGGGGFGAAGDGPAGAGPGTTTPPGTGAVIITSASPLVGNGPLTITAASAGFYSTITILPPGPRITQNSAANAREQRAKETANTKKMRLNFTICRSLFLPSSAFHYSRCQANLSQETSQLS